VDQATLVADRIGAGQDLIDSLHSSDFVVKDAFWSFDADDDQWYLFLVSPYMDHHRAREAYTLVQSRIRSLDSWRGRDPLDVKIVGTSEPIARAVAADIESYPDQRYMPLRRVSGLYRDGVYIKEAWIYPRRTH
jgi:hypothetical protein